MAELPTTNLVAGNNPAANVAQANGQQQNEISPITIPIQIQPTVAGQNTQPIQSVQPVQDMNNLQTNPAPTPQTYQKPTNQNTVDFNQIYSAYQSQYGNNPANTNNNSTGIKKTSLGTTIVTPSAINLNTVQGQYQSAYADTVNGLISSMLSNLNNRFEYDPTQDNSLRMASEYAANSTLQSLAGSGVLNSSATAERVARIVSELIPTYEEKAHSRYVEYLGQLADTAQLVMNFDNQQFNYWKDAKDREFKEKEAEYKKQQDSLENAWKRVDELGYVDNRSSTVLGVPVGTLSSRAREAIEDREFQLQKMREQSQIEYENNKALYKLRSELNIEEQKAITENEYKLAKTYGTSKANTTSLSTYQNIINNRWADYDEISKKYTVSDNDSVYNYLLTEYAAGRLSDSDLANLSAMYGITRPLSNEEKQVQAQDKMINAVNEVQRLLFKK